MAASAALVHPERLRWPPIVSRRALVISRCSVQKTTISCTAIGSSSDPNSPTGPLLGQHRPVSETNVTERSEQGPVHISITWGSPCEPPGVGDEVEPSPCSRTPLCSQAMVDHTPPSLFGDGFKKHSRWRSQNLNKGPDLSGANLVRADLRWANLIKADLTEADLRRASLIKAHLGEADLSGANLTEANLTEADLTGANLTGANLNRADLFEANLTKANLTGANLHGANLRGANLRAANLKQANLRGANLIGADLNGANLFEASLIRAHLGASTLFGANLTSANLGGADLTEADLAGAKWNLEAPPLWPEGFEPPENARRRSAAVSASSPPVLRLSVDLGLGTTPPELAKHVALLSDVATLVEALVPSFAEPKPRETSEPARGGGGVAVALSTEDLPSFVVHTMRYENPLAMDLAIWLPAAGATGAVLKYQEQLRKTVDWIADWKATRPARRARVFAIEAEARADTAKAQLEEAQARKELAELQRAAGEADPLPREAGRTLLLIGDKNIEIEPLEP